MFEICEVTGCPLFLARQAHIISNSCDRARIMGNPVYDMSIDNFRNCL